MCVGFIHQLEPEDVTRRPDIAPVQAAAAMQVLDDIAAEMANLDHLRQRSIREMKKALRKQQDLDLDRTEETMALIAMAAVHPITVVRALIQFGYEPFPTSVGCKYAFFGRYVNFLPNIFSYMRQLAIANKTSTLFEGLDSAICVHIIGGTVDGYMWSFLGNAMEKINTDVRRKQSWSTALKFTLRLTLTDIVVKIVTRPFKVIMFRQISCIIGNEPVFSTIRGLESGFKTGWTDLFTGLRTELRNVLLGSFLAFLGRHAINRIFFYHYEKNEKEITRSPLIESAYDVVITAMNRFTELGLSVIFQCTIGCPLEVTSKVRAIAGTRLVASNNYPSECKTHHGSWDHLTLKNALFNGFSWFLRIKPAGPGLLPEFSF